MWSMRICSTFLYLYAGAGLLPLLQSRVSMVYYVLLLLRCFSCSHTVLPKEHSLGVIFFLLTFLMLCCIFLQFPVFLSCLPPCHICMYVWTGWWLISLVLVTSDNKGLLLLLLFGRFGHICSAFLYLVTLCVFAAHYGIWLCREYLQRVSVFACIVIICSAFLYLVALWVFAGRYSIW